MSKAILYAANTSSQTLAVNGVVDFGSVVRRYGNCVGLSGGNPVTNAVGYYEGDVSLTFTAEAGTATFTVCQDGVAVPGATVSRTTVASTVYTVSIPFVVRQRCCLGSTVTVVLTGAAATLANAAIVMEKE